MKTLAWLLFWVVIAGVGTLQFRKNNRLDQPVDALLWKQNEELSALEQELKRAAREAEARRVADLEKAWGGPLAAALKNPAFSLREALYKAAQVCAPTNTLTGVEVDRFTEFTVNYESASPIATNDMVAASRKLMPVAKEYLDAVRFSVRGKLVAEIDRSDIEYIEDWERAPEQRIVALLPREAQSRIVEDAVAIERLKIEMRISQALEGESGLREKAENADRQFRQMMEEAFNELNKALTEIRKAATLHEVRSLRGFDERVKQLREAVAQADRAEQFWKDPAKEWERVLGAEGISGELRELLVTSFPAIFRQQPEKTAKVFEALRGEIESVRFFQKIVIDGGEHWKFTSEGIAFSDPEFTRRIENVQRQLREDAEATNAAVKSWTEAIGP